tara:strand:- start:511 stop:930 length:420 start_codon:yes stop_codon:yes gene_type:complete
VRGVEGASWNNKRPAGVALSFQVRKHVVEAHADVASNVLSNDPSGPEFSHEPTKFWPEVAVIFLAPSLPCNTKGLARIPSANNVNWSNVCSLQFPHVPMDWNIRPMFCQYLTRKFFNLAKGNRFKSACSLKAEAKSAYS